MKQAIIYARVSTEEQAKKYSLSSQVEECRKYALEQGYTVIAEREEAYSGEVLDRPKLLEVFDICKNGGVDVLIVYDIDRLSRNTAHHAIIEMQLEKSGTEVEYVLGDYNNKSPEANLSRSIKQAISEYENMQRRERIVRGRSTKVKSGKVITGARSPYGYDSCNGVLTINSEEAIVVRKIYQWLSEGDSTKVIARKLHEQGIPSRADKVNAVVKQNGYSVWHPSSVRKVLKNQTYTGTWHFNKTKNVKVNGKVVQVKRPRSEWLLVNVPQIIDESTFNQAQKLLAENQIKSKRNTKREYLLRGMVFCTCGLKCECNYRKSLLSYRCPSKYVDTWTRPCETKFYIRASVLEDLVWNAVVNLLLNPDYLKIEAEKQRQKAESGLTAIRSQLEAVESAISDTQRKIGILLDQLLDDDFPRSIVDERKKLLTHKLKQLESEKTQLQFSLSEGVITPAQEKTLILLTEKVKKGIDKITFEHKHKLLEMLRVRVDVCSKHRVRITGILPMFEGEIDTFEAL